MKLMGVLLACTFSFAVTRADRTLAQTPFVAYLDGSQQNTPNDSPGSGFAVVTVDLALHTVRIQVRFENLLGVATAAGIYAMTAQGGAGTAGSATPLPSFTGFPLGQSSGAFDLTFSFDDPLSFNPDFISANGGIFVAPTLFAFGIGDGRAYVNIPSAAFPEGEIRGFLLNAQAADFDLDGIVAASDLAVWRQEYGRSTVADATRDALAEGADLLIWQRQLGRQAELGGGLGHHVAAAPEPAGRLVAAALAGGWSATRRRMLGRRSTGSRHK